MAALHILTSLSLLSFFSLVATASSSQAACKSHKFTTKKTAFDNCIDLPTLNALLHWTYHPSTSSFSGGFTARPRNTTGWAAWALNPLRPGMLGAQALIAHRPSSGGPISVDTYNLQSYTSVTKGPISYNVTGISAEESAAGEITIFATWAVPKGESTVNQVWQVGPLINGQLSRHDLGHANLGSTMKLNLVSGPSNSSVASPAPSPATGESPPTEEFPPPLPRQPTSGAGKGPLPRKRLVASMIFYSGAVLLFLL